MKVLDVNIHAAGYEDSTAVIQDMQFSVEGGELVGIIGPNGAGKSTTIKAIMGLLSHMSGQVDFTGPRRNYAYIPEQPVLYDKLTLWEHLELAAAAQRLDDTLFKQNAHALLERFKLTNVMHHFPSSFSKGMQQKVMLVAGFMAKPDLYIIDEPFIGLDPHANKDLLDLMRLEQARGAGVLMSTHVLDTAERICDRILFIQQGELAASGTMAELRQQCGLPNGSLLDCFVACCGDE